MRFAVICFLFLLAGFSGSYSYGRKAMEQQDSATTPKYHADSTTIHPQHMALLDSVALATEQRQQFVTDSLATMFIMPDPDRPDEFTQYIMQNELYKGYTFLDIPYKKPKRNLGDGHTRASRDPWIIVLIAGLLLYTALLNITMGADIKSIFSSFYSKRTVQMDKDDRGINAWTLIGLFLLFASTFGLFLYQLAAYNNVYYSISGVQLFAALSLIIISLFSFKFLILKIIGFLFDIDSMVGEYITTLYLTYFNIAFVFLPVVLCFSLLAAALIPYLLVMALVLIVIIFVWIYLRSSVSIISNFRFHKFYLFVYLCALEICPILILIKVLNL
jgi:hypothetical protein